MKRRILALLLAAVLCGTSGCTALLDRSFLSITPHAEHEVTGAGSSVLRAETYQSLVSAVRYCVVSGLDTGEIQLYNYTRDVEKDLAAACLEVIQNDPLGAYAVDYMKHNVTRILSYYKVTLDIRYRRTPKQIAGIVNATGSSVIRTELGEALQNFRGETALRIGAFSEDEAYIKDLISQAYRETPLAAFGEPTSQITLYPKRGTQRIVEIILTYPEGVALLQEKSDALEIAARDLLANLLEEPTYGQIYAALRRKSAYRTDTTNCATPYGALVDGAADSQGLSLGLKLLCDLAQVPCTVVAGALEDGTPHHWVVLTTPDGPRHVDVTRASYERFSDAEFYELGFRWDSTRYPACGDPIPSPDLLAEKSP